MTDATILATTIMSSCQMSSLLASNGNSIQLRCFGCPSRIKPAVRLSLEQHLPCVSVFHNRWTKLQLLRSRGRIGRIGLEFSFADMAAQITVEIPRQLSSRLFLGVRLPFPRLHTPKRASLVSSFAVYSGGTAKAMGLIRVYARITAPYCPHSYIRQCIGCIVQDWVRGQVYGRREYVIVERCTLSIPDK